MSIKPFTDEERKASLERALKNAEENTPFDNVSRRGLDEYGNYGENNPSLEVTRPFAPVKDKEYDS